MFMSQIADEEIKECVCAYQISRSPVDFAHIRDVLSSYIYHYPRKVFRASHEEASGFYLSVIEKLDSALLAYRRKNYRFMTWFTVVLRNSYFNYVRKINATKRRGVESVSFQSPITEDRLTLEDVIGAYDKEDDGSVENTRALMEVALKKVSSIRDSLIFRMHYLELYRERIIPYLRQYFEMGHAEAALFYEKARDTYIEKYRRIMRLQDSITSITRRIEKSEGKKQIDTLKKRKDGYVKTLNSVNLTVPYKFLASSFKISVNAVTKVIKKTREFVKAFLEGRQNERLSR